jgi:hypothetical protein
VGFTKKAEGRWQKEEGNQDFSRGFKAKEKEKSLIQETNIIC